jgi:hypothetical protein
MYRYEPQKIAKAFLLMEISDKKKKLHNLDLHDPFETAYEKNKIQDDIRKHIVQSNTRISWIGALKG